MIIPAAMEKGAMKALQCDPRGLVVAFFSSFFFSLYFPPQIGGRGVVPLRQGRVIKSQ